MTLYLNSYILRAYAIGKHTYHASVYECPNMFAGRTCNHSFFRWSRRSLLCWYCKAFGCLWAIPFTIITFKSATGKQDKQNSFTYIHVCYDDAAQSAKTKTPVKTEAMMLSSKWVCTWLNVSRESIGTRSKRHSSQKPSMLAARSPSLSRGSPDSLVMSWRGQQYQTFQFVSFDEKLMFDFWRFLESPASSKE